MTRLIAFIFIFPLITAFGQKAVPFQLRDDQLMTLDSNVIKQLIAKQWRIEYLVRYGQNENGTIPMNWRESRTRFHDDVRYFADHSCKLPSTYQKKVTWQCVGDKLIRHESDSVSARKDDRDFPLEGDYGIYELTDSTLIMVKTMTSDLKVSHQYFLKEVIPGSEVKLLDGNKVTIALEFTEPVYYKIHDVYGNLLKEGYGRKVNVKKLPKGAYYVTMTTKTDNKPRYEKFFKG